MKAPDDQVQDIRTPDIDKGRCVLRLYIAGESAKSKLARSNLKGICEAHLADRYDIEVIDLIKDPQCAAQDRIFAIPTLVRLLPAPQRRMIGDLSNTKMVLSTLDIQPERTLA